MKYKFVSTKKFDKDYKNSVIKRGYNVLLLKEVIDILLAGETLPVKYKDHSLSGNWAGYRECHITSDWLLIYYKDEAELILIATRTGTHSDLF
ncbi:addiction module toxin, RelE/StbE family [Campylobacterota bacterium]|nr:addiction module toxin, RelE/StbE family [Campylobacterota bacterium]